MANLILNTPDKLGINAHFVAAQKKGTCSTALLGDPTARVGWTWGQPGMGRIQSMSFAGLAVN